MKNLLLIILSTLSYVSFSQVMYRSYNNQDFKEMIENGVTFIKTENESYNNSVIRAFEKNWKVTKFHVFDPKTTNEKLNGNQIVIYNTKINNSEPILAWIKLDRILKDQVTIYATIGYVCFDGFNQKSDDINNELFLNQIVAGFNDAAEVVLENKIKSKGVSLYKDIYQKILPKSKSLKGKTLLILDKTTRFVRLGALNRAGIKYRIITTEEFSKLNQEELSDYCLMYFAFNSFTEISIYDLDNDDLIFTRHYAGSKRSFGTINIKKMTSKW